MCVRASAAAEISAQLNPEGVCLRLCVGLYLNECLSVCGRASACVCLSVRVCVIRPRMTRVILTIGRFLRTDDFGASLLK